MPKRTTQTASTKCQYQAAASTAKYRSALKRPPWKIIVTKGTLDWAYPPFILATTAASMDVKVSMFFTFYCLGLLKKKLDLKVSPLGNPAMAMKANQAKEIAVRRLPKTVATVKQLEQRLAELEARLAELES